jgi:hypothetical protein
LPAATPLYFFYSSKTDLCFSAQALGSNCLYALNNYKERWAALVTQIGECRDAQKIEQLQREAGKILREAIQPEAGKTGPSE